MEEFDWSDEIQGVILSSFSYGYIATQLFGGYLAGRFGAKKTIFCGIALSTVCTLVGPLASLSSPYLLIVTQIFSGFGQVGFPLLLGFIEHWKIDTSTQDNSWMTSKSTYLICQKKIDLTLSQTNINSS